MSEFAVYDQETGKRIMMGTGTVEITAIEPIEQEQQTIKLISSFEGTLTTRITGHEIRTLTGTDSNNERKMHHIPKRRRRNTNEIN